MFSPTRRHDVYGTRPSVFSAIRRLMFMAQGHQCTTVVYSLTQRPKLMPYGASVVSSRRGLCPLLDDAASKSDTSHLPATADADGWGGGGGNVTIGRAVATKGGKTSLHIPLRQVGQVACGRRAVGAAFAVDSPLLRSTRPEKPLGIGFPGKEVVEKTEKSA